MKHRSIDHRTLHTAHRTPHARCLCENKGWKIQVRHSMRMRVFLYAVNHDKLQLPSHRRDAPVCERLHTVQWWLVHTAMKIWVPKNEGNLLTCWATASFSRALCCRQLQGTHHGHFRHNRKLLAVRLWMASEGHDLPYRSRFS